MTYNEEENEYTLSTGRTFYANNGILGLGPDPDEHVSYGYDGTISEFDWPDRQLTVAERHEIADEMIARWKRWAVPAAGAPK